MILVQAIQIRNIGLWVSLAAVRAEESKFSKGRNWDEEFRGHRISIVR